MASLWYRWHGQHLTQEQQLLAGVHKAQHPVSVYFQLFQQQIAAKKVTPLPKLGKRRQARTRFWANWLTRWHTLIQSGFDIGQSLEQLLQQSRFQEEAQLCFNALQALQQGQTLAQVFQQGDLRLPARSQHLLAFAEQAGQLDVILKKLSDTAQQTYEQERLFRQALFYPATVLFMVALLGLGLKLFILPKFATLYADAAAELPKVTQYLLMPNTLLSLPALMSFLLSFAVFGVLLAVWLRPMLSTFKVRDALNRVPLWYSWYERPYVQQDLHALSLGLQHGMTLQQAVLSIVHTHRCAYRRHLWLQGLQALQAGQSSLHIFAGQGLSPEERALIHIGEQAGKLETKLAHIAANQYQEFAQRKKSLLGFLPNMVLILVSIATATVMIALYLPLFQLGLAVA